MNFGDMLDAVGEMLGPEDLALAHGTRRTYWPDFTARSNRLARNLREMGIETGDKAGFYLRNQPEYTEALAACFKGRFTHVNVNYRYLADELFYIFDNSDAAVVFFDAQFTDQVELVRGRLPKLKAWVQIGGGDVPDWAVDYDCLAADGDPSPLGIDRSPEDLFFLYTGGTTGMPKGVMWPHHDLREVTLSSARKLGPVPETLEALREHTRKIGPGGRALIAPPLMHGTGLLTAIGTHLAGGSLVTLAGETFDPVEMLDAIERHKPQSLTIVGDSFARPILNALNANPGRWDVSSVAIVVSSGVMWSLEVKRGLLEHMPQAMLSDAFSSSEALGMGSSIMTKMGEVKTAKFMIGERCRVFDENDQPVEPGSGVRGLVALGPPNPIGYYKDDEKTARTFRVIDGVRYSIPGDWCIVEADGTLTLLGRGNACINTAGEKVFPEEVEEALKTHPSIEDALVVGLPDEKWGQAVTAVVELAPGRTFDEAGLKAHVRKTLAGYKTPKRVFVANRSLRASNGKADYAAAKACAETGAGEAVSA